MAAASGVVDAQADASSGISSVLGGSDGDVTSNGWDDEELLAMQLLSGGLLGSGSRETGATNLCAYDDQAVVDMRDVDCRAGGCSSPPSPSAFAGVDGVVGGGAAVGSWRSGEPTTGPNLSGSASPPESGAAELEQILQALLVRQGFLEDQEVGPAGLGAGVVRPGSSQAPTLREMRRTGLLGSLCESAQTSLLGGALYQYGEGAADGGTMGMPASLPLSLQAPGFRSSMSSRRTSVAPPGARSSEGPGSPTGPGAGRGGPAVSDISGLSGLLRDSLDRIVQLSDRGGCTSRTVQSRSDIASVLWVPSSCQGAGSDGWATPLPTLAIAAVRDEPAASAAAAAAAVAASAATTRGYPVASRAASRATSRTASRAASRCHSRGYASACDTVGEDPEVPEEELRADRVEEDDEEDYGDDEAVASILGFNSPASVQDAGRFGHALGAWGGGGGFGLDDEGGEEPVPEDPIEEESVSMWDLDPEGVAPLSVSMARTESYPQTLSLIHI